MKKSILNEINEMKYLFGYKRGVVISEQAITTKTTTKPPTNNQTTNATSGEPWVPLEKGKTFMGLDRYKPLLGKTAIFKPIPGTAEIKNAASRDRGDSWTFDEFLYGRTMDDQKDMDSWYAKRLPVEALNGKIAEVYSTDERTIKIYLERVGESTREAMQSNVGFSNLLKEITYKCGTKKFELHFQFDNENSNPKLLPFLFGKHIFIDATCDGLADALEKILPCDKGHHFSLKNGDLENLPPLENLPGTLT